MALLCAISSSNITIAIVVVYFLQKKIPDDVNLPADQLVALKKAVAEISWPHVPTHSEDRTPTSEPCQSLRAIIRRSSALQSEMGSFTDDVEPSADPEDPLSKGIIDLERRRSHVAHKVGQVRQTCPFPFHFVLTMNLILTAQQGSGR